MISVKTVKTLLAQAVEKTRWAEIRRVGAGRTWEVFRAVPEGSYPGIEPLCVRVRRGQYDIDISLRLQVDQLREGYGSRSIVYVSDRAYSLDVYRWIDGVPIKPGDGMEWLPDLVQHLQHLHTHHPLDARPFATDEWVDLTLHHIATDVHYLASKAVGLNESVLWRAKSLLVRGVADLEPVRLSLIHRDLSNANVLLAPDDPTRVAALIDWDTATFGDYMWDLADWATFHDGTPERFPEMLRLYHGYIADTEIHPLLWRRFWVYFTAISIHKLAFHHRISTPDVTRSLNRVKMGVDHLSQQT